MLRNSRSEVVAVVKRDQMINRFLGAGRRALWCLSVCAVSMGAAAQEPLGDEERDDDDEPKPVSAKNAKAAAAKKKK